MTSIVHWNSQKVIEESQGLQMKHDDTRATAQLQILHPASVCLSILVLHHLHLQHHCTFLCAGDVYHLLRYCIKQTKPLQTSRLEMTKADEQYEVVSEHLV